MYGIGCPDANAMSQTVYMYVQLQYDLTYSGFNIAEPQPQLPASGVLHLSALFYGGFSILPRQSNRLSREGGTSIEH